MVESGERPSSEEGPTLEAIRRAYWHDGLGPDDVEALMRSVESRLQLVTGRMRRIGRLAPFVVIPAALYMFAIPAVVSARDNPDAVAVWLLVSVGAVAVALAVSAVWARAWATPPSVALELPEDIRIMRQALAALDPADRSRLLGRVGSEEYPHLSTMDLSAGLV